MEYGNHVCDLIVTNYAFSFILNIQYNTDFGGIHMVLLFIYLFFYLKLQLFYSFLRKHKIKNKTLHG